MSILGGTLISGGYVYSFCYIFQGVRLLRGLRLFQTLEYIVIKYHKGRAKHYDDSKQPTVRISDKNRI